MKLNKATIRLIIVVASVVFLGLIVFYLWEDISLLLGLGGNKQVLNKDVRGQSITFTVDSKNLTIPPIYSDSVYSYIKKELTEKGGLPFVVGKKGSSLPFGIP